MAGSRAPTQEPADLSAEFVAAHPQAHLFLRQLRETATVTLAAERTGVSSWSWRRLISESEEFGRAYEHTLLEADEILYSALYRRLRDGWEERRRQDNRTTMALLQGRRPELVGGKSSSLGQIAELYDTHAAMRDGGMDPRPEGGDVDPSADEPLDAAAVPPGTAPAVDSPE